METGVRPRQHTGGEVAQYYVALNKNGVPASMIQYKGMSLSISGSLNQLHRLLLERQWLNK